MARTYEELLAAQTELAHFNQNHDPRNGQFAKGHGGTNSSASFTKKEKKTVLKRMREDQKEHFRSQISDEAAKVTRLGRNGYDERGSDWNAAYRKGKVTSKDDKEIKAAAKATRDYMNKTYGKELTEALSKSSIFTGTKTIDEYLDNYGGMKIKELLADKKKRNTKSDTKKISEHKLSLKDIDDPELIDLYMEDPDFRKEYNVTKQEYDDWKRGK